MMSVPLSVFGGHVAIVGRTGSGKSFLARRLVELWLEAGERVCVIDPTDVWNGLRSNAAGDGPGYPVVIFGGDHADIPIGDRSGIQIAQIIGSRNLPAVISTVEMSGGERHRFMTDFLGTLYRANKTSLHLVIDEADDIGPQNPLPENRRMLGDIDRIVRRGRVKGFQVTMITQRPAVLNKNLLSQASTLVAMRLPAPQDRKAIEDWIKGQADIEQAREVLGSLSKLNRGEGWVWAPDVGVLARETFPMIRTFDSMRTPEHGEAIGEPTTLADVEIGDLRALLQVEREDAGEARNGRSTTEQQADVQAAEQRGYERGLVAGRAESVDRLRILQAGIENAGFHLDAALNGQALCPECQYPLQHCICQPDAQTPPDSARRGHPVAATPSEATSAPQTTKTPVAASTATRGDGIPVAANKMLSVLARGLRLTWVQTATLAGLKARGGSFNTARKALRDAGYIEESDAGVIATQSGLEVAGGALTAPDTPSELMSWWKEALPSTPGRVLEQLHKQGKWTQRDRLAGFLGMQPRGGSWNTALSILRANKLIEQKGDQLRSTLG